MPRGLLLRCRQYMSVWWRRRLRPVEAGCCVWDNHKPAAGINAVWPLPSVRVYTGWQWYQLDHDRHRQLA